MFYYLDPSTPPPPPVARTIFFLMAPTTREGLHHSHWPLFTTQVDKEEKGAPVSSWERCEVPMQAAAVSSPLGGFRWAPLSLPVLSIWGLFFFCIT